MRITATLFATAFWLMATTPTLAAECEAPCLSFSFTSKLKSDWVFSANPSSKTGIDTGPSAELELRYAPTDQLSFVGVITGESVNDRRPGENRTFKDLGLYAGALYAEYAAEPVTFRLGKFDPDFSLGSATLDGQYAAGLSDTYDTEERWGVQAVYAFPGEALSQSLTASLFTTDRSVLSQSLGTDRGRLSLDDGGAGNVKGIGSAAAFYDICSGAETGPLGFPVAAEDAVAGGRVSRFQTGRVAASPATGAHWSRGPITDRHVALGAEPGPLGFPTTDEYAPGPGIRRNDYEHGWIAYDEATSTVTDSLTPAADPAPQPTP